MRLNRLRAFLASILFLCLLFVGQRVSAISGNWSIGPPEVVFSKPVDSVPSAQCRTTYMMRKISGESEDKKTCIDDNGAWSLGFYISNNNYQFVVRVGSEKRLFKLKGLECDYTCIYSSSYDTLVIRKYIVNNYVKSMAMYNNFSKRVQPHRSAYGEDIYYSFDDNVPSYIFQSSYGYAWPVNGLGISANGRWLGVELRQRGMVLIDLASLSAKRISSYSYSYGYGYDPTVQISVSNDGNTMIAIGENAGMRLFSSLNICGDETTDDNINSIVQLSDDKKCSEVSIETERVVSRFYMATHPRFTSDGLGLRFYAVSYAGEYRDVYLKPAGYQIYHPLKMLGLGDSYTSGEGEDDNSRYLPYTDTQYENCHTSDRSYPYLLGNTYSYHISPVKSVACSGATTDDILGISSDGDYVGQGNRLTTIQKENGAGAVTQMLRDALIDFVPGRLPQLDFALEYTPDVMLIGIGGNDVDLVGKLKLCMMPGTCRYADNPVEKGKVAVEIRDLYYRLIKVYSTAIQNSPGSLIYAVGYPQIISVNTKCDLINGFIFDDAERQFMRETIHYINQVVRAAATASGIGFADIEDAYGDATLCGTASRLAMNGITGGDDVGPTSFTKVIGNESFHPNPYGHQLVASKIAELFPYLTSPFCSNGMWHCPVATVPPQPGDYWTEGLGLINPMLTINLTQRLFTPAESAERERRILLHAYSLSPGSTANVTIYSNPLSLGDFIADDTGALDVTVNLPASLSYGYHRVVVSGVGYAGDPVEYYQTVFFAQPISTQSQAIETPAPAITQIEQSKAVDKAVEEPNASPPSEVLGETIDKKLNILDIAPLSASAVTGKSNQGEVFWYWYIGSFILTFILAVRLLYKRRRRNTIKS